LLPCDQDLGDCFHAWPRVSEHKARKARQNGRVRYRVSKSLTLLGRPWRCCEETLTALGKFLPAAWLSDQPELSSRLKAILGISRRNLRRRRYCRDVLSTASYGGERPTNEVQPIGLRRIDGRFDGPAPFHWPAFDFVDRVSASPNSRDATLVSTTLEVVACGLIIRAWAESVYRE
jgi:hypothetical protein